MTDGSWIWVGNINSEFDLFGSRILMGIGQSGVLGIALSITGRSINSKNKSVFLGLIMASGSSVSYTHLTLPTKRIV